MKKQFWVDVLLTVSCTLLLVSCASLRQNSDITVNTALNLAAKQIELGRFDDAINTYNLALNEGNDNRLLYNKSILQAKLGLYKDAIITAEVGYKLYPDKSEFLKAIARYCYQDGQIDKFVSTYEQFLKLNDKDINSKVEYVKLCADADLIDKAYSIALDMWESGIDRKEIVSVLYSINPDEWEVLNRVLN